MSYNVDAKGILVDALKGDAESFSLANLILPNKRSLKAVHALYGLRSDLLEFAKNPETANTTIGAPPIPPKTDGMSEDEALQAIYDYTELRKLYQQQKEAFSLHVPYADYMQIKNYLDKYFKTLQTTSAVKGNRFYAFTKNSEKPQEGGLLAMLKGGNGGE